MKSASLYAALEVGVSSTPQEIKRAHRRLVMIHHPDKGGDEESFKRVNEAYEVLSDPERRKMYDATGEKAPRPAGPPPGGFGPFGPFGPFGGPGGPFGGPGPRQNRGGPAPQSDRSPNVAYPLRVSLKEMCVGNTRRLTIRRRDKCASCIGKRAVCPACSGTGSETVVVRMGNTMQMQTTRSCSKCAGAGCVSDNACPDCADGTVEVSRTMTVEVVPGCPDRHRIVMKGEAGFQSARYKEPGDIVIEITQQDGPDGWVRRGSNLFCDSVPLSLRNMLVDAYVHFEHVDGKLVQIMRDPGHALVPGAWIRVPGLGTPIPGSRTIRGDLHVRFRLDPASCRLEPELVATLDGALGKGPVDEKAAALLETVDDVYERRAFTPMTNERVATLMA